MNTASNLARQGEFQVKTQPHFPVNAIPKELVAVAAYHKWRQRCEEKRTEVHGYDKVDWLEAEREIRNTIRTLNGPDIELFAKRIQISKLQPPPERIAIRAYFIFRKHEVADAQECWLQALIEEREIVFASLFVDFCQIRSRLSVCPRR